METAQRLPRYFSANLNVQKKANRKKSRVCLAEASTDDSVSRNSLIMKLFGAHSENLSTLTTLGKVFEFKEGASHCCEEMWQLLGRDDF